MPLSRINWLNSLSSRGGGLAAYKSLMAFWGGEFDFDSNVWLDKSGNGNDVELKNASARTGNGSDLDYTITGLLTTDTVTVETGSDTPTIPSNGTLRIGSAQTVYGVTINRSGETWAVIPFCEPKPWSENMPTTSYDVSGNEHHAVCASLAEGNITTQSSYFYLQRYGYSKGGNNRIDWDFTSWSGTYPNEIFAGTSAYDGGTTGHYVTEDNGRLKIHMNASGMNIREYSGHLDTTSKHRLIVEVDETSINTDATDAGVAIANAWMYSTYNYFIKYAGTYIIEYIPRSTTFQVGAIGSNLGDFDIVISSIKVQVMEIIPALMDGTADALGNEIEIEATGNKWLEYGCELALADNTANKAIDQKGCWSDIILSGLCVNGETYLVEQTESDHFGSGVEQFDEFVSDGTETCDRDNRVRQLIENDGERGLFFTDAGVQVPRSFDEVKQWHPQFVYANKDLIIQPGNSIYDNVPSKRWDAPAYDVGYMSDFIILKSASYLTTNQHLSIRGELDLYDELNTVPVVISWDHLADTKYDEIRALMAAHSANMVNYWNYGDPITKAKALASLDNGDQIGLHTAYDIDAGDFIPEYKGFHETSANYTQEELEAYYAAAKEYFLEEFGLTPIDHAYPGGGNEEFTRESCLKSFNSGRGAQGSGPLTNIPFTTSPDNKRGIVGAISWDTPVLSSFQALVDEAITSGNLFANYAHPSSYWDASDLTIFDTFLDYIRTKQTGGDLIRIMRMDDAIDMIQRKI